MSIQKTRTANLRQTFHVCSAIVALYRSPDRYLPSLRMYPSHTGAQLHGQWLSIFEQFPGWRSRDDIVQKNHISPNGTNLTRQIMLVCVSHGRPRTKHKSPTACSPRFPDESEVLSWGSSLRAPQPCQLLRRSLLHGHLASLITLNHQGDTNNLGRSLQTIPSI